MVLTSTHNLFFMRNTKNISFFLSDNFQFLEVNLYIYLNRSVFVMVCDFQFAFMHAKSILQRDLFLKEGTFSNDSKHRHKPISVYNSRNDCCLLQLRCLNQSIIVNQTFGKKCLFFSMPVLFKLLTEH